MSTRSRDAAPAPPDGRTAELRGRLGGEITLSVAVGATIEAWRSGAPFGLALVGDAHRAEALFRRLRPHADVIVRTADADESPPRAVRTLALCTDPTTLASIVRRRCTAVVDVGAVIPPGRRPPGESEARLWRRVVAGLAAHGVHDGAIDVAACALASALVDAGYHGDPVALVRAWVAVPHGRSVVATGAGEVGATDQMGGDDAGPETDADSTRGEVGGGVDAETGEARAEAPELGIDGATSSEGADEAAEQASDAAGDRGRTAGDTLADPTVDATAGDDGSADDMAAAAGADGQDDPVPSVEAPDTAGDRPSPPVPDDGGRAGAAPAGLATDAATDATASARAAALAVPDLAYPPARATVRSGRSARRGAMRAGSGHGRPGRIVAPERAGGRIAMLPTIQRAAHRLAAAGARGEFAVTRDDLRGRLRAQPTATHTVVVVDGSSSMGDAGAAHARRVADVALGHAYRDRGDVSVILAAGSFARVVQERTPRVSRARAALQRASVEGGGGTPLADAVRQALDEFADAPRERCRLVIVSDGQPTVDLAGRADPRTATRDLRAQLDRAATRAGRTVFVPLDPRGWAPLERTLAPFRAAGVEVSAG